MSSLVSKLQSGARLYDRLTGAERLIHDVEIHGKIAFVSFKHPQTGTVDRQPFSLGELQDRFEVVDGAAVVFRAKPEIVSLVVEAYRLRYAYLFNDLFATETSLIDLLPHQLAAVYGVPSLDGESQSQPGMLDMPRLRFLLADDAGAGKTIMAGLLIREMLLRRQVRRVLVAPPAGLVSNWERELRVLFRLRFHVLSGPDFTEDFNPFADPRGDLAIISVDTLWRDRARTAYEAAPPYDLVIFDEAHKLAARIESDLTIDKTHRYQMAEFIARQNRHLLLMTATPHMGKDDPYYLLWRLLEPDLLSTTEAFRRMGDEERQRYLLRRMKEEMVRFDGSTIFPPRESKTPSYPLTQGPGHEQDLYDQVTLYCQTHFDRAKLRNRSAAGLAMSILQRRLASSTWAIYRSLERREDKLQQTLRDIQEGLLNEDEMERRQNELPTEDVRDTKTGDEEEILDGQEESEYQDEKMGSATDARTQAELETELTEVRRLKGLARKVYDAKHESKFEKLWELIDSHPDTKVLIFTEFRDTLAFLVGRLEGKGLTGKIAQIYGGMDYAERERQVEFFRDPAGARVMAATDAAGEGINLQFCWLLINYDIPWNPARLEQRMGRVHRYKQEHDVLLFNLVSENTREGRVLKVLLEKLDNIRQELSDDKVFDIIGRQFTGKPLTELIFEAVVEGREEQAKDEIERVLTPEHVQAQEAAQNRQVELSEVRAILDRLNAQRERAEMRRMMPAYVRRFFQIAAPLIGVSIQGDIEGIFHLDPCPPVVRQALAAYPAEIQQALTFDQARAMPDLTREPRAIYLHPGEPVFEAVSDLFLGHYEHHAMRGGVFFDDETTEPYIFYLTRVLVLRDRVDGAENATAEPEIVEESMAGVRRYADGRFETAPAHLLLTLLADAEQKAEPRALLDLAGDTAPVEAFVIESLGQPALKAHRYEEETSLPHRVEQTRVAYNLRQAELFRQLRILKEQVEKDVPFARSKLRRCEADLQAVDSRRREAEATLYAEANALRLGPVSLYAQALVLPLPPDEAEERRDAQAEQVALDEVMRREKEAGAVEIEDVSKPHRKEGFDLKILYTDGSVRYVEVKGRRGHAAVEMTENEWAQAANHRDRYWLYVVYDCDTVPELYRVPDPFGCLLAKQMGAVRINASKIVTASVC